MPRHISKCGTLLSSESKVSGPLAQRQGPTHWKTDFRSLNGFMHILNYRSRVLGLATQSVDAGKRAPLISADLDLSQ